MVYTINIRNSNTIIIRKGISTITSVRGAFESRKPSVTVSDKKSVRVVYKMSVKMKKTSVKLKMKNVRKSNMNIVRRHISKTSVRVTNLSSVGGALLILKRP